MADKLPKLQEIQEPRMDENNKHKVTSPMQQMPVPRPVPRQSPRLVECNNHNPAAVPRLAQEYARPLRVLKRMDMDTTGSPSPQQPDGPRWSSRIAALQWKIAVANVENLYPGTGATSPQSSPAQNTRSKMRPNCTTEVRTIKQKMVLACIETYVKVTQTPLQPAQLA